MKKLTSTGEQKRHRKEVTTSLTLQEQKSEPCVLIFCLFSYTSCVYFSLFTSNILFLVKSSLSVEQREQEGHK